MWEENEFAKPIIAATLESESSRLELREKLYNPTYLPTHHDIATFFGEAGLFTDEWYKYCRNREKPVYEFLNEEFLNALTKYLSERIKKLRESDGAPVTILEVCAGSGRLSHFLRGKLEIETPGGATIIATDSGGWKLKTDFPVEFINHKEALKKYKPQIVICSWMPYKVDFSGDFRATTSVKEYLLIGESDGGNCGDEWATWGSYELSYDDGGQKMINPYIVDGFERENLDEISSNQICRTDTPGDYYHSKTVSFRRKRR